MDWKRFDAVLFDLDGVLTPTAEVHMKAWARMFKEVLADYPDQDGYTDQDYYDHVDGKPRYDGVHDLLAARGIELPYGDPDDDPQQRTICGLGNRKNDTFNEIIARDGVDPYPGSVTLLDALAEIDVKLAVVSSSKNAPAVLEAAGLADRFSVVVDGAVAARQGLPGKPQPDTFVHAAQELGADAAASVVVEDAVSGIQAGAAGPFALVVGVDRGAGHDTLTAAGADVVVDDLAELAR